MVIKERADVPMTRRLIGVGADAAAAGSSIHHSHRAPQSAGSHTPITSRSSRWSRLPRHQSPSPALASFSHTICRHRTRPILPEPAFLGPPLRGPMSIWDGSPEWESRVSPIIDFKEPALTLRVPHLLHLRVIPGRRHTQTLRTHLSRPSLPPSMANCSLVSLFYFDLAQIPGALRPPATPTPTVLRLQVGWMRARG
ncbi:hypothetical protein B0H10DRAFT_2241419 [Mycena sp. CBHHK59/15]|nr:hypothetical protein B0H10DRAFT_2241419 [Mycena sp. CBHHK59/15]